jgi:hypothetical protein
VSIDYADALERSRDQVPVSNGTEGYGWMENWCDRCLRDASSLETGRRGLSVADLMEVARVFQVPMKVFLPGGGR